MLAKQLHEGRAEIEVAYRRGVSADGNATARARIAEVFEPCDAEWRGIGVIPGTGLSIRPEFAAYDAALSSTSPRRRRRRSRAVSAARLLRGITLPYECKLFGRACTPEHPIGPCMVSSEGSCAAY